jgi:hypothetical protein
MPNTIDTTSRASLKFIEKQTDARTDWSRLKLAERLNICGLRMVDFKCERIPRLDTQVKRIYSSKMFNDILERSLCFNVLIDEEDTVVACSALTKDKNVGHLAEFSFIDTQFICSELGSFLDAEARLKCLQAYFFIPYQVQVARENRLREVLMPPSLFGLAQNFMALIASVPFESTSSPVRFEFRRHDRALSLASHPSSDSEL